MARIARFAVPGLPHHVTQRGNRGEPIFFDDNERCGDRFADLLNAPASTKAVSALRAAETIGRPLGSPAFLDFLAATTGGDPRPKRWGRSRE